MLGRTSSVEPRKAYGHAAYRLSERRRTRRRRAFIALCILILLGTGVWGLGQNAVRISRVEILGLSAQAGDDSSLASYATSEMQGSYLGAIPRDSVFFFPEERIRADILASHNDIAAVSILRNGFTGISIKVDYRVPIARWCGSTSSPQAVSPDESCYVFDASGVIFSTVSTTTQTINTFKLYAPLVGETLEPLRASIKNADKIPAAFDFARQFTALGSPVTHVVIRGDEVDNILENGTRVTYVLGNERNAFTALVSSRDSFNLTDGSVDYVDLRFDGKVYLKKK